MHKELIIEAFEKARKELESKGVNGPSNHQAAILISDSILKVIDFSITSRSISNYYKSANEVLESEDIKISQSDVVLALCKYLGYVDYLDFIGAKKSSDSEGKDVISKTKTSASNEHRPNRLKRNIVIVSSIAAVLIIGVIVFMSLNQERWMVWNVDHYEEADFNKEDLANGTLKLFKEERIENFKKINNVNCDYEFFNEDGGVNVWYGKNKNGNLDVFTDIGLHPETGKSLKPITAYMVRKYLCDSY